MAHLAAHLVLRHFFGGTGGLFAGFLHHVLGTSLPKFFPSNSISRAAGKFSKAFDHVFAALEAAFAQPLRQRATPSG
jgi:hypothetical protein